MDEAIEARVQQWVQWLDAGIELRVPTVSVPYCDTRSSVFECVGFGRYVRMDEWTAFEAGHGYYGGTERTDFTLDELLAYLSPLAVRSSPEVEPWTWMRNAGEHQPAADVLDRVRRGEIALDRWYCRNDNGQRSVVIGDGERVYWIRLRGAVPTRVERLSPALVTTLDALPIHSEAIAQRTPEHDALLDRARRYEQELARVLDELDRDRDLAYFGPQHDIGVSQGARVGFRQFWDINKPAMILVTPSRALVSHLISWALLSEAGWALRPIEPSLRARLSERERELCAMLDELRELRVAFCPNSSLPYWRVWHGGRGYEVELAQCVAPWVPRSATHRWPSDLPVLECAMQLAGTVSHNRLFEIDAPTRASILAMIEALPR